HEVTCGVRVRHRDRATPGDLPAEQREDAPVTAEDIAESHRQEHRGAAIHCRQETLRDPLGHAHHTHRSDGLVGRDEDKLATPASAAACAPNSVPNTLFAIAASGCASMSGTCLYAAAW